MTALAEPRTDIQPPRALRSCVAAARPAAQAPGAPSPVRRPAAALQPPGALAPRRLAVGGLQVAGLLGALVLAAVLAPGLGEVRGLLADASLGWLAVAVGLQLLSCLSYVVLFRSVFCRAHGWRTANRVGWGALAVGSIVPSSGAAGLAYASWALAREGEEPAALARRSVAFFLVKGSVNFVAVAVLGGAMALGLIGPDLSPWITGVPAALAAAAIVGVLLLPRLGAGAPARAETTAAVTARRVRARRALAAARAAAVTGTGEALAILRRPSPLLLLGTLGYWLFDNAVLWATFQAFGADVDPAVILLGYLIGQLGGLLPIPGGVGGIDGGLIGALVVFGAPAAATAAAVLAYRVILFWLPLLGGALAAASARWGADARLSMNERPRRTSPARSLSGSAGGLR